MNGLLSFNDVGRQVPATWETAGWALLGIGLAYAWFFVLPLIGGRIYGWALKLFKKLPIDKVL